ncbi:MAG: hypothetical protein MJ237_03160 [bacterium]|nr:hypothetical protein [bacterium]
MDEEIKIIRDLKFNNTSKNENQYSNPLNAEINLLKNALGSYEQVKPRMGYDDDTIKTLDAINVLNNMVPIVLTEYNFNFDEINGEYYYKPDGSLLLIREYYTETFRDYYCSISETNGEYYISRILEHDAKSGRLKIKIEPVNRSSCMVKQSITIFDNKINKKYMIIQISDGGVVNNFSEFSGVGKSFQTLFRDTMTFKPVRYVAGKDVPNIGFSMVDCILDAFGNIARMKRYTNNQEIQIDYTQNKKHIKVRQE